MEKAFTDIAYRTENNFNYIIVFYKNSKIESGKNDEWKLDPGFLVFYMLYVTLSILCNVE